MFELLGHLPNLLDTDLCNGFLPDIDRKNYYDAIITVYHGHLYL